MASIAIPQPRQLPLPRRWFEILPGIFLLAGIGLLGKLIERSIALYGKSHHLHLPNIEYVLWAILIGFAVRNTVGVHPVFGAGIATYDFWLKSGIVLMGARFLLGDVAVIGGISLGLVAVEIAVSLAFMTFLGRVFGLNRDLTALLAVGSSVCGVSAIIAAQGAIDADDEDASFAIAAILSLGALSLLVFPPIGHWLHMTDYTFGIWSGLAVDNTAEAVATGAIFSDNAQRFAALAKTARNAMIGFVVLGYALRWAASSKTAFTGSKAGFLWKKFPKFVLGFLLISSLASLHFFDRAQTISLGNLSRWAFLLTFAGVGLRTDVRALGKQGARPFVVGFLGEILIAVFTLGLVLASAHWAHF
jgi:Predicted membrane protein